MLEAKIKKAKTELRAVVRKAVQEERTEELEDLIEEKEQALMTIIQEFMLEERKIGNKTYSEIIRIIEKETDPEEKEVEKEIEAIGFIKKEIKSKKLDRIKPLPVYRNVISFLREKHTKEIVDRLCIYYFVLLQGSKQEQSSLHSLSLDVLLNLFLKLAELYIKENLVKDDFLDAAYYLSQYYGCLRSRWESEKNFYFQKHGVFWDKDAVPIDFFRNRCKENLRKYILEKTGCSFGNSSVVDIFFEKNRLTIYFSSSKVLKKFKKAYDGDRREKMNRNEDSTPEVKYNKIIYNGEVLYAIERYPKKPEKPKKPESSPHFSYDLAKVSFEGKGATWMTRRLCSCSPKRVMNSWKEEDWHIGGKLLFLETLKGTLALLIADNDPRQGTVSKVDLSQNSLTVHFDHPDAMRRFLARCETDNIQPEGIYYFFRKVTLENRKDIEKIIEKWCKLPTGRLFEEAAVSRSCNIF